MFSNVTSSVPQTREVPDPDSHVPAGGHHEVPAGVEGDADQPVLAAGHRGHLGPALPVPDPDRAVVAA